MNEDQNRLLLNSTLILGAVTLTSLAWYFGGTYETATVRTLLETSVSIVLTGIVVVIYYKQWRTEREQADIAGAQRDIANAMKDFQSRPALDVVDIKPVRYGWQVHLGNFGFGPAHALVLEIDMQTSAEGYTPQTTTIQLKKQFEHSETDQMSTNAILPKSEAETFLAENIDVKLEESDSTSLCTLCEELAIHGDGSDTITIDLTVHGVDAFDKEYTCDAEQYSFVVEDLQAVSEYHVSNVVGFERN